MAAQDVAEEFGIVRGEDFFLALFNQVVERINDGSTSNDDISASIQKFVGYCRENRKPAGVCAAGNFETDADFLGYFYWSSPVSAGVTRSKTLAAIQDCAEFRSCFDQPSVKVVSVGGGTGSDLVGLYSALYGNSAFRDMEVVVIDNNIGWEPYFRTVDELLRTDGFGNASQLVRSKQITTSFICADLPLSPREKMVPECRRALGEAHIVWMKGFLSVLTDNFERHTVTAKIISSMTPGTLLVVVDSPAYDEFDDFVVGNQLRRVFATNHGGYELQTYSTPMYRFVKSTNQELIIFERIVEEEEL